jgi:hypothetical protein
VYAPPTGGFLCSPPTQEIQAAPRATEIKTETGATPSSVGYWVMLEAAYIEQGRKRAIRTTTTFPISRGNRAVEHGGQHAHADAIDAWAAPGWHVAQAWVLRGRKL